MKKYTEEELIDKYVSRLIDNDEMTDKEWATSLEGYTDEEIGSLVDRVEEETGHTPHIVFYAVQETSEDPWDYGSYKREKAIKMLKEQGHGQIAVIDHYDTFCLDVMYYDDVNED